MNAGRKRRDYPSSRTSTTPAHHTRTMTMTIDANQQRYGHLNFDHMSSYPSQPHFTNPWGGSSSSAGQQPTHNGGHAMFVGNQDTGASNGLPPLHLQGLAKHPQHGSRGTSTSSNVSMASFGSLPAASSGDLLSMSRMQHPASSAGYTDTSYTTASPVSATYAPAYNPLGYAPAPVRHTFVLSPEADQSRRYSQPDLRPDDPKAFRAAIEASHGMMALSEDTPRNLYEAQNPRVGGRGSDASYGFPSGHSTSSSISSTGYSGYYGGSVDSAVSDYSTGPSDVESFSGRTLPPPHGLIAGSMPTGGSMPPAPLPPQSMMGQFSSKVTSSAQKKHVCRICDKRFTRPSSLQTHMYSHTGEKPFICPEPDCKRQFSVVSNLRRHRKVHRDQHRNDEATPSETSESSEDHQSPQSD